MARPDLAGIQLSPPGTTSGASHLHFTRPRAQATRLPHLTGGSGGWVYPSGMGGKLIRERWGTE